MQGEAMLGVETGLGRRWGPTLEEALASPPLLRQLPRARLPAAAAALRGAILESVARTGGHLGAGLGVVELALALHYVFDTPRDRLLWDVGHQGYPHKFLTGRGSAFSGLGRKGGLGKFLRRTESAYDVFGAGHAGTSISAAVGIAEAIRRRGGDERVVAVIGDGALTAGMAYEGLNGAGFLGLSNLVVVVNDNGMSISPNVGALSRYLRDGGSRPTTRRIRATLHELLESVSVDGERRLDGVRRGEEALQTLAPAAWFEAFGFRYVGAVDGHDTDALVGTFERVRALRGHEEPVLVHVRTEKGRGYAPAERDPVAYHGVTPFDLDSGRAKKAAPRKASPPSWTAAFADGLVALADADARIVGVTAAMADGTGLSRLRARHPERFYDAGIAEQHAVTMAAGMASEGLKPVCAIYSTFLQRAFDQVIHDVCVQGLDVTFALDRAGLVGADGATHQGLYDMAYLRALPGMVVMAPKDENELRRLLRTAIEHPGPAALRFPRGAAPGVPLDPGIEPLPIGEAELLRDGADVALIGIGASVAPVLAAAERLAEAGIGAAVLNARFAKPLDAERITSLARATGRIVTVEEHVRSGGFGEAVAGLLAERGVTAACRILAVPDRVVEHGDPGAQRAEFGLDAQGVADAARALIARSGP